MVSSDERDDLIVTADDAARRRSSYFRLKRVPEFTQKGIDKLSPVIFGPRAGGDKHRAEVAILAEQFQEYRRFHTWIGFGTLAGSHPDFLLTPPHLERRSVSVLEPWDRTKQIAGEVERNPYDHHDKARNNYIRNVACGLSTFFSVPDERQGKAVASAIRKLKDPKVLAAAVQKAKLLSDEQKNTATEQIKRHWPKMVAMSCLFGSVVDKLLGQKPTAFGVFVRLPLNDDIPPSFRSFVRKTSR